MRAVSLLLILATYSPIVLILPHVGVLLWCWIALMNPQQMSWGNDVRLNVFIAVVTLVGWAISREPKRVPWTPVLFWLSGLLVWMAVSTHYALFPELAQGTWDRNLKTALMLTAIMGLMRTRTRLHALAWIMAVSIGYYGVKGGAFVIATAGAHSVVGPANTNLADNNSMALGLMLSIPILNYLRLNSRAAWIRWGLLGAIALTVVAILGTYSRGGLIGLAVLSVFFWYRVRHRIRVGLIGAAVLVPAVMFMPQKWEDKMSSIQSYEHVQTAQSRLDSWRVAFGIATERPLVGGGFNVNHEKVFWDEYAPGKPPLMAHSIYFQTLSDLGAVGLALYLAVAGATWRNTSRIARTTRGRPEWLWAHDLAKMIQVSLVGFLVAGAFGPWAYYDFYFALVATAATLRRLVDDARPARAAAPRPFGRPAVGRTPRAALGTARMTAAPARESGR